MDKLSSSLLARAATATTCPPDDPEDVRARQLYAFIPTVIIMTLSVATYLLRLYCRRITGQKFWWDDWLMGLGVFFSLEPAICELLLVSNGLGHHICNLSPDTAKRFAVIAWALQRANQPTLVCIKLSIVLFYMRIFSATRKFRIAAHCVNAYNICWGIATFIINLTVCTPIAFYYDKTIPGGGTCRNQAISGSVNGGLSLLGDIFVLCLPIPVIWGLKVDMRRRIGIICVFLLGIFVCVASIIRITELVKFTPSDPSYTQGYASTWTTLEQGVAAVSGNLPLLMPLFDRCFRRRGTTTQGHYENGSNTHTTSHSHSKGNKSNNKNNMGISSGAGGESNLKKFSPESPDLTFHVHDDPEERVHVIDVSAGHTHEEPAAAHTFYKLSDEESQSHAHSADGTWIEMDDSDKVVLVKT